MGERIWLGHARRRILGRADFSRRARARGQLSSVKLRRRLFLLALDFWSQRFSGSVAALVRTCISGSEWRGHLIDLCGFGAGVANFLSDKYFYFFACSNFR